MGEIHKEETKMNKKYMYSKEVYNKEQTQEVKTLKKGKRFHIF